MLVPQDYVARCEIDGPRICALHVSRERDHDISDDILMVAIGRWRQVELSVNQLAIRRPLWPREIIRSGQMVCRRDSETHESMFLQNSSRIKSRVVPSLPSPRHLP